jgi:hypothetical protein
MNRTKTQMIEDAARDARVSARRSGRNLDIELCWDIISGVPEADQHRHPLSAKAVLAAARKQDREMGGWSW